MKFKKVLKLLTASVLLCATIASVSSCGLAQNVVEKVLGGSDEEEFYYLVSDTQELLDKLGDDIYENWYDAVYDGGDIDEAIERAFNDNEDRVEEILYNTEEINALYKEIKDGDLADEAKEVMHAYNDYYTLVMEVSGSFNNYSEAQDPTSKALSSALKNYYLEL